MAKYKVESLPVMVDVFTKEGQTVLLEMTFIKSDGTPWVLTGETVNVVVKDREGNSKFSTSITAHFDEANGVSRVTMPYDTFDNPVERSQRYPWNAELVTAQGEHYLWFEGDIIVQPKNTG